MAYLKSKPGSVEEAITAAVMQEKLSPKQQKLDKNNNGKIDGSDLAKLRAKKEVKEEDAYENDRYIIKNGKATLDNSNTPDKKNHVYADGHKDAEKKAKEKGIKEDHGPKHKDDNAKSVLPKSQDPKDPMNIKTKEPEKKTTMNASKSDKIDVNPKIDYAN